MAGYIGVQPVPKATQRREYFTATNNQTTFNTAGYTPDYVDVYMNGVKLSPADFTATNGSDVVLASGATTGDLLQIISFLPFQAANQAFTGTFGVTGAVDFDSTLNVDGNATFGGTINTTGTSKLQFGDTGTYIHQSADGVLDLVSDTEIEINATTIDMNGTLEVSGNITGGNSVVLPQTGVFAFASTSDEYIQGAAGTLYLGTDGGQRLRIETAQCTVTNSLTVNGAITANSAISTDANTSTTGSQINSKTLHLRTKGNNAGISGQTYSNQIISSNGTNVALEIYTIGATGTPIVFGTNSTERMRIDTSGDATFAGKVTVSKTASDHTSAAISIENTQNGGYGGILNFVSTRAGTQVTAATIGTDGQENWSDAANTSSNLKFSTVNDGTLAERMKINSSGNVFIRTGNLQFGASGSETGQIEINSTRLLLRSTGNASGIRFDASGLTPFKNGSASNGGVDLGFDTGRFYDLFLTNRVKVGSGGGIDFAATGQASGMTNELLDDYEEGQWTISFPMSTSGSYTPRSGYTGAYYTKVGNLVTIFARFETLGESSPSGNILMSGFPFNFINTAPSGGVNSMVFPILFRGYANSNNNMGGFFAPTPNTNYGNLYMQKSDTDYGFEAINESQVANFEGSLNFTYLTE